MSRAVLDEWGMVLLGARFDPTTQDIGHINGSLWDVVEVLRRWFESHGNRIGVERIPGGLPDGLAEMKYLRVAPDKVLVVETADPSWSAVLINGINGTGPAGALSNAVTLAGMRGCYAVFRPDFRAPANERDLESPGARHFSVVWPDADAERGYGKRYVAAQRESGSRWVFQQFGEPLDFEDTDAYLSRRIRDRLTPTMLVDYCAALGLRPFDDAFYTGPCVMLRLDNPRIVPAGLVRYPYKEFQEERGWGPQAWARRAQLRIPRRRAI